MSAEEALRCLDPQAALELFELADPADDNAQCGRIRALWALRRADEARAALDALPPQVRASAAGQVAAGTIALGLRDNLLQLGVSRGSAGRDGQAALDAFASAVALDPEDPIARRGFVTAYRLAEQAAEARATVDGAIAELGPLPGLLVESAWCHFDLAHDEAALKVLESAPEDIEALFAKAAIIGWGEWAPDAMPVYDHLRRLVPETSLALHVQLADYLATMTLWTVGDADRAEFREHARQALALLPGNPTVLLSLSYVSAQTWPMSTGSGADADVGAELYDDSGLPESPAILLARYWAALRENRLTHALAHARRARVLDPHLGTPAVAEVYCLSVLGRNREASIIAETLLERFPERGAMRYQLAMLEAGQGHPERALELFPDDIDPRNVVGRIAALRQLGDFAAAESLASHPPRRPTGYWEWQLREESAQNSIAQRHWKQAVTRLDAVLELDPANSEIRRSRRAAARRARLGLSRRPPSEDTDTAIADTQNLTSLLDDLLPPGSPPSLRAQLHQIRRRERAVREDDDHLQNIGTGLWVLGALAVLVLSYWALRVLGASENTELAIALPVSELVAFAVVVTWLANDGPWLAIRASTTLVGFSAAAAVLLTGHGHPSALLLFPSLDLVFVATSFWSLSSGVLLYRLMTAARWRRQRRDGRFGYLVHDMLDLLVVLEYEPALIRPEVRRECLAILERIARGQEQVLMAAIKSGGGVIEEPTEHAFRHHVAAIVAATRDLKRDVLSPGPGTWAGLRARLRDDLAATCHGHWNLLPYRPPDPPGRVLRIRLFSALRSLMVLLIPPGLLYLASATRLLPFVPSQPILLIGYLVWPGLVILLWLDPQLATKVNLVKAAGETVSVFKQDKSAM